MEAAVAYSSETDARAAVDEVLPQLRRALRGQADLAIVLATSGFAEDTREMLARISSGLGQPAILGGSTTGVISPEGEHEDQPGLGVLALRGLRARAALLSHADDLARFRTGPPPALTLALPDPRRLDAELMEALLRAPGPLAGAGIAGEGQTLFSLANVDAGEGVCAIAALEGVNVRIGVAQGAAPAAEFLPVTRSRRNAVLELGGQPAAEVFRAFVQQSGLGTDAQLPALLFVAILEPGADQWIVRPIVGVDPAAGALLLPDEIAEGSQLAFAWREALAAARDRKAMLARITQGPAPRAALYFNCAGRGSGLFPEPDADLTAIRAALPNVPLLGMTSSFELGPLAGKSRLLMYTGVLVVLSDA